MLILSLTVLSIMMDATTVSEAMNESPALSVRVSGRVYHRVQNVRMVIASKMENVY